MNLERKNLRFKCNIFAYRNKNEKRFELYIENSLRLINNP